MLYLNVLLRKKQNVRLNYQQQYYQENKEEIKKYTKQYYELNKDKLKQKRKGKLQAKKKQTEKTCVRIYGDVVISFK